MKSTTEHEAFLRSENKDRTRVGRGPQILRLSVTLALTVATVASAQTYRVLKDFNAVSDGAAPRAGLVLAGSTLYGTTAWGGSSTDGDVFKMNTDGSGYTVLKTFTGSDGSHPLATLLLVGSTLYGTTMAGGSSHYDGVVFKVNIDGSGFAVLKNFTGSDGSEPWGGLVLAESTLYGTTYGGGSSFYSGVFKVNTNGSGFAVLKRFTDNDGSGTGLVLAGSTLYGAAGGGSSRDGVVFKMNTDGSSYTVLKDFNAVSDGAGPNGLVLADSMLYGTTYAGGSSDDGVVFKVNTDGSGYTVLKTFTGSDGRGPGPGGLVLAGSTLYGTTIYGGYGPFPGYGMMFKVNTDGSGFAVLKSFTGSDGSHPYSGLVLANGTLYGTAVDGGSSNLGVVFSLAGIPIEPPSITSPPLTQTAETGTAPWFGVEVTNTPPEATYYEWYFNSTNVLSGATNAFLRLTNVQPAQAGAYTVVVTNLVGAVTSAPALLSVIPPVVRTVVPAVSLTGGTGSFLHLEYADSLAAPWSSLSDVTLSGGPQLCLDLSQPLPAQRFYRTWQTNGPQPALDASMATEIPLAGTIGSSVRVDYINAIGPTDSWVTLNTVTLTNTTQLFFDVTAFRQPARLYRLVAMP